VGVVVPAAGAGRRLGGGEPKALATLDGRALLALAVEALEANDCTTAVVVVSHADAMEATAKLLAEEGFTKLSAVVAGGPTRQASVAAGPGPCPTGPAMWPSTTWPGPWSARGRSTGC
jgi:2-C-methyl-D-erythritol 4-phosphate cytidylyltransferase